MPVVSEIATYVSGIVTGLLTNVVWDQRRRVQRRIASFKERERDIFNFKSASVDLFPINRWSQSRPLDRSKISMRIETQRPLQTWLNESEWQDLVTALKGYDGETAYLIDFSIDHREAASGLSFRYTVTPCNYREHLATVNYLSKHPEAQSKIRSELASGGVLQFARTSPPSVIKVNVAVVNEAHQFLAIKRSGAVYTKKGLWTVGPNETMQLGSKLVPGAATEDLFGLSERCLREELGLDPRDYGEIFISWIGYDVKTASVKVFAQVATYLSPAQVSGRLAMAHGLFEVQDTEWLRLDRHVVTDVIRNWEQGDSTGRMWSASAPLALQEIWRSRSVLRVNPRD